MQIKSDECRKAEQRNHHSPGEDRQVQDEHHPSEGHAPPDPRHGPERIPQVPQHTPDYELTALSRKGQRITNWLETRVHLRVGMLRGLLRTTRREITVTTPPAPKTTDTPPLRIETSLTSVMLSGALRRAKRSSVRSRSIPTFRPNASRAHSPKSTTKFPQKRKAAADLRL